MGKDLFNASDAISWASCRRRAWLDHNVPPDYTEVVDPFDELVQEKGLIHERDVLATLGNYETAVSIDHTQKLMARQTPLIYQGFLVSDSLGVVCQPDFLRLDDGEYRALDAKLASRVDNKKEQMAQIGAYDIVLGSSRRAQALLPEGETYELTDKNLRTAETFLEDMMSLMATPERPDANFVATKCNACPYRSICVPEFEQAGNLGLNYFVDNRAIPELKSRGIGDLNALAAASVGDLEDVPYLKKEQKQERAILQSQSFLQKRVLQVGDIVLPPGNAIHFDIETWPFGANGEGEIYLYGFFLPPYGPDNYEYVWADDDEVGFRSALDMIEGYRQTIRDAVLVHYSPFELQQIRRLAERYGLADDDTVQWVLGDSSSCFDIRTAIIDALILPLTGYGLKAICKSPALVNFQWELEESSSQWSVVRYADYLASSDTEEREAIKAELLSYNRDDVRATRAQEVWLAGLRG